MKLCPTHESELRTQLWMRGVVPRDDDHRPPGDGIGEPLSAARSLFYANCAKSYGASVMLSPADMCPACQSQQVRNWLALCAESIALQQKREAL